MINNIFYNYQNSDWLSYFDLTIIYLFCIFQISYNTLTFIKISQSKNQVNFFKMTNAYFYLLLPIFYSIYPLILSFESNYEFGLMSIYLRIPPIGLSIISVLVWSFYIPFFNKKIDPLSALKNQNFKFDDSFIKPIQTGKNFFKKGILKYYEKQLNKINNANKVEEILKIVKDNQGWFIKKDKFSWMWLYNKNKTHYFYQQIVENIFYIGKSKIVTN